MTATLIIILFSLVASAFFSGMEIAFVSANRLQIELEKSENLYSAKLISKLIETPGKFIATMILGNNIALVVYGIYMGDLLTSLLFDSSKGFVPLLSQTLISTAVILITAEYLPKVVFRVYANELLRFFAVPITIIFKIFSFLKISSLMIWISQKLMSLTGNAPTSNSSSVFNRVDLENFINEKMEDGENGELDTEINIFQNALEFRDLKARDCMIPRKEITAVSIDSNIDELSELFIKTGYSKILVYKDSIDNIIGYVHSFELFKKPTDIKNILMPVINVLEVTTAQSIMNQMILKRKSVAIVLDEYGGTSGLITMEDVLEEILGEIEDEHDQSEHIEEIIGERKYLFSSRLKVEVLNSKYNLELPEEESYESLGGLIINLTEDIPKKGEKIYHQNFIFTIDSISGSKLETIEVEKLSDED